MILLNNKKECLQVYVIPESILFCRTLFTPPIFQGNESLLRLHLSAQEGGGGENQLHLHVSKFGFWISAK